MSRHAVAVIDLNALAHNFRVLKSKAPNAKVWSVIKADAYGHGATTIAHALANLTDGFAVAHLEEAMALRAAGIHNPLLLMEGVSSLTQVQRLVQLDLQTVIHNAQGLAHVLAGHAGQHPIQVWLKVNTGMNRLGIAFGDLSQMLVKIQASPKLTLAGVMTHLACADEPAHPMNARQIQSFDQQTTDLTCDQSIANSSATLALPSTHRHWIRPGIALYGSSPLVGQDAQSLGLKPVMHLNSQVIAVRSLQPGDTVGYSAAWKANRTTRTAIVGVGYGDGYPRSIIEGHIWINNTRCPLIGRVSMDMCVVRVPEQAEVAVGDSAQCWGEHISIDQVAEQSNTISYELMCKVTSRVPRVYSEFGV